jgi:energy-coupling factor transporter ATP-binding protein EcfA2
MEILKALQQAGHTVIVITHNKEIAEHCADRVILMDKGRIISDSDRSAQ